MGSSGGASGRLPRLIVGGVALACLAAAGGSLLLHGGALEQAQKDA